MALEKSFIRLVGLVVVTAALACVAPASAQTRAPADPMKIDSGLVAGKLLASGVRAYLGMPYARSPVGEQRWREPAVASYRIFACCVASPASHTGARAASIAMQFPVTIFKSGFKQAVLIQP